MNREKEKEVAALLVLLHLEQPQRFPLFTSHNRFLQSRCSQSLYKPDFFYDLSSHFVLLEVDERQHRSEDAEQEFLRMQSLTDYLRCSRAAASVYWVRYNPDHFALAGAREVVTHTERWRVLKQTLLELFAKSSPSACYLELYQLFYNHATAQAHVQHAKYSTKEAFLTVAAAARYMR